MVTTLSGGLDRSMVDYFGQLFARYEFREKMRRFFERYDLLLSPTLPCAAFGRGSRHAAGPRRAQHRLLGLLHLSLQPDRPAGGVYPGGLHRLTGLPVGLQMVAGINREVDILRAAAAFEEAAPWADRRPLLY